MRFFPPSSQPYGKAHLDHRRRFRRQTFFERRADAGGFLLRGPVDPTGNEKKRFFCLIPEPTPDGNLMGDVADFGDVRANKTEPMSP
jgi:hypothetical protein